MADAATAAQRAEEKWWRETRSLWNNRLRPEGGLVAARLPQLEDGLSPALGPSPVQHWCTLVQLVKRGGRVEVLVDGVQQARPDAPAEPIRVELTRVLNNVTDEVSGKSSAAPVALSLMCETGERLPMLTRVKVVEFSNRVGSAVQTVLSDSTIEAYSFEDPVAPVLIAPFPCTFTSPPYVEIQDVFAVRRYEKKIVESGTMNLIWGFVGGMLTSTKRADISYRISSLTSYFSVPSEVSPDWVTDSLLSIAPALVLVLWKSVFVSSLFRGKTVESVQAFINYCFSQSLTREDTDAGERFMNDTLKYMRTAPAAPRAKTARLSILQLAKAMRTIASAKESKDGYVRSVEMNREGLASERVLADWIVQNKLNSTMNSVSNSYFKKIVESLAPFYSTKSGPLGLKGLNRDTLLAGALYTEVHIEVHDSDTGDAYTTNVHVHASRDAGARAGWMAAEHENDIWQLWKACKEFDTRMEEGDSECGFFDSYLDSRFLKIPAQALYGLREATRNALLGGGEKLWTAITGLPLQQPPLPFWRPTGPPRSVYPLPELRDWMLQRRRPIQAPLMAQASEAGLIVQWFPQKAILKRIINAYPATVDEMALDSIDAAGMRVRGVALEEDARKQMSIVAGKFASIVRVFREYEARSDTRLVYCRAHAIRAQMLSYAPKEVFASPYEVEEDANDRPPIETLREREPDGRALVRPLPVSVLDALCDDASMTGRRQHLMELIALRLVDHPSLHGRLAMDAFGNALVAEHALRRQASAPAARLAEGCTSRLAALVEDSVRIAEAANSARGVLAESDLLFRCGKGGAQALQVLRSCGAWQRHHRFASRTGTIMVERDRPSVLSKNCAWPRHAPDLVGRVLLELKRLAKLPVDAVCRLPVSFFEYSFVLGLDDPPNAVEAFALRTCGARRARCRLLVGEGLETAIDKALKESTPLLNSELNQNQSNLVNDWQRPPPFPPPSPPPPLRDELLIRNAVTRLDVEGFAGPAGAPLVTTPRTAPGSVESEVAATLTQTSASGQSLFFVPFSYGSSPDVQLRRLPWRGPNDVETCPVWATDLRAAAEEVKVVGANESTGASWHLRPRLANTNPGAGEESVVLHPYVVSMSTSEDRRFRMLDFYVAMHFDESVPFMPRSVASTSSAGISASADGEFTVADTRVEGLESKESFNETMPESGVTGVDALQLAKGIGDLLFLGDYDVFVRSGQAMPEAEKVTKPKVENPNADRLGMLRRAVGDFEGDGFVQTVAQKAAEVVSFVKNPVINENVARALWNLLPPGIPNVYLESAMKKAEREYTTPLSLPDYVKLANDVYSVVKFPEGGAVLNMEFLDFIATWANTEHKEMPNPEYARKWTRIAPFLYLDESYNLWFGPVDKPDESTYPDGYWQVWAHGTEPGYAKKFYFGRADSQKEDSKSKTKSKSSYSPETIEVLSVLGLAAYQLVQGERARRKTALKDKEDDVPPLEEADDSSSEGSTGEGEELDLFTDQESSDVEDVPFLQDETEEKSDNGGTGAEEGDASPDAAVDATMSKEVKDVRWISARSFATVLLAAAQTYVNNATPDAAASAENAELSGSSIATRNKVQNKIQNEIYNLVLSTLIAIKDAANTSANFTSKLFKRFPARGVNKRVDTSNFSGFAAKAEDKKEGDGNEGDGKEGGGKEDAKPEYEDSKPEYNARVWEQTGAAWDASMDPLKERPASHDRYTTPLLAGAASAILWNTERILQCLLLALGARAQRYERVSVRADDGPFSCEKDAFDRRGAEHRLRTAISNHFSALKTLWKSTSEGTAGEANESPFESNTSAGRVLSTDWHATSETWWLASSGERAREQDLVDYAVNVNTIEREALPGVSDARTARRILRPLRVRIEREMTEFAARTSEVLRSTFSEQRERALPFVNMDDARKQALENAVGAAANANEMHEAILVASSVLASALARRLLGEQCPAVEVAVSYSYARAGSVLDAMVESVKRLVQMNGEDSAVQLGEICGCLSYTLFDDVRSASSIVLDI